MYVRVGYKVEKHRQTKNKIKTFQYKNVYLYVNVNPVNTKLQKKGQTKNKIKTFYHLLNRKIFTSMSMSVLIRIFASFTR